MEIAFEFQEILLAYVHGTKEAGCGIAPKRDPTEQEDM